MLENTRYLWFSSPRGRGEDVKVPFDESITLSDVLSFVENVTGFGHDVNQYHFSLDAVEITNPYAPLRVQTNSRIIASYSKVSGN